MPKKLKSLIKNSELIKSKRKQIALGASKLLIKKGFHESSVREIAEVSGLTIGNLYDYIESKDDVIYLVFDEFYSRWTTLLWENSNIQAISDPKKQLLAAIECMMDVGKDLRDIIVLAYREAKSLWKDDLKQIMKEETRLVTYFEQIIRRGTESGDFRDVDAALTANTIVFLLALIPLRGWNFMSAYSEDEVKKFIIDLIFNGIIEGGKKFNEFLIR